MTDVDSLALLTGMLAIPSPSGGEADLAGHLRDRMTEAGLTAHVDAAGNVIGVRDCGSGPTVMLLGHMDTVDGYVPIRRVGDRLYGRGAVDAKGPLAAMVSAAATVGDFAGRLVVVGVVEEETPGSRGAVAIRDEMLAPDALIIGEPSGWSSVVLGYKGRLDIAYHVDVPQVHPTYPAPKAAEFAAAAWHALLDVLGPDVSHATFDTPGPVLTSIAGDLLSADVELSVRTPPGFDAAACLAGLRSRLPAGTFDQISWVPACRVGRTDPVVRALTGAIRGTGSTPGTKLKTATSDMNILAERWRIPMATYGPGDSRLDHTADEHILVSDYLHGIDVLCGALPVLSGALLAPVYQLR